MGNWKFKITLHVEKFIVELPESDVTKIKSIFLLFEEYGPTLPAKYIKKISGTKDAWELRAKRVRIFFYIDHNTAIGVQGIIKKSQKTPKKDINLAINRIQTLKEERL